MNCELCGKEIRITFWEHDEVEIDEMEGALICLDCFEKIEEK